MTGRDRAVHGPLHRTWSKARRAHSCPAGSLGSACHDSHIGDLGRQIVAFVAVIRSRREAFRSDRHGSPFIASSAPRPSWKINTYLWGRYACSAQFGSGGPRNGLIAGIETVVRGSFRRAGWSKSPAPEPFSAAKRPVRPARSFRSMVARHSYKTPAVRNRLKLCAASSVAQLHCGSQGRALGSPPMEGRSRRKTKRTF